MNKSHYITITHHKRLLLLLLQLIPMLDRDMRMWIIGLVNRLLGVLGLGTGTTKWLTTSELGAFYNLHRTLFVRINIIENNCIKFAHAERSVFVCQFCTFAINSRWSTQLKQKDWHQTWDSDQFEGLKG